MASARLYKAIVQIGTAEGTLTLSVPTDEAHHVTGSLRFGRAPGVALTGLTGQRHGSSISAAGENTTGSTRIETTVYLQAVVRGELIGDSISGTIQSAINGVDQPVSQFAAYDTDSTPGRAQQEQLQVQQEADAAELLPPDDGSTDLEDGKSTLLGTLTKGAVITGVAGGAIALYRHFRH